MQLFFFLEAHSFLLFKQNKERAKNKWYLDARGDENADEIITHMH